MNTEFDEVAPDASAMIESLRAHGYTLASAIADIIDNSIAAECKHVWLTLDWAAGNPWISISDDGNGMTETELVNAMRLGSKNPLELRHTGDLGRFGLGLKTASFSQARRLTVVSAPKNGKSALRRWDLDHLSNPQVKGWQLLKFAHSDTQARADFIAKKGLLSGTVVVLEVLDRVISSHARDHKEVAEKHWVQEVARVRQHLAMVFHRFLSDTSKNGIEILLNGTTIEPWDPFCTISKATQPIAEDSNSSLGGVVKVKGFVLPHRDKFDLEDPIQSKRLHQEAAGPMGWNAQQGFYLYRNRRLIIPGDWLGLGPGENGWKKEEHFKLARIRVDIPNSMDQEWQIDVKKSAAIAPPALRSWLTGLAKLVRERAKEVYAHRGGRPTRTRPLGNNHIRPWVTKTRPDGTFSYCIDRKHALFAALITAVSPQQKEKFETLLRLIEETVPVQRIWIDTADNQDGASAPFEGEAHINLRKHIKICHSALVANGLIEEEAWQILAAFPAFQGVDAQAIIGQLQE